jgi:hypothetical protein
MKIYPENLINNHFINTSYPVLPTLTSNKEDLDGRACSTYEGEERCVQGFGGETSGKETT